VENPLGYSLRSLLLKEEEPCPLILAHGFLYQSNLILFTAILLKKMVFLSFWHGYWQIPEKAIRNNAGMVPRENLEESVVRTGRDFPAGENPCLS